MAEAFPAGQWSEVKLICLGKYLSAYLTVIMKKFPRAARYYVDLFAGPGLDEIRPTHKQIDGSPLRALNLKRGDFTKYIFVEEKPSYFEALSKRVAGHERGKAAEVLNGDCNDVVRQIVSKVPQESPLFLFVDPRGLDIHWQTVKQFAAHRHLDMLMTFPYDLGIKRCAYDPKSYNTVDMFYGTQEWRDIAKQRKQGLLTSRQARDAFAELYVSQLRGIGLNFAISTLLRTKIVTGKPLYHMIFASRYFVALDIWKSITSRQVGTLDRFLQSH